MALVIQPVKQSLAKDFIRQHHRHLPNPPHGWKFGASVWYQDQIMVGVIMVGRPVARALDDGSTLEVNRSCVRTDLPKQFTFNANSKLYGWACREAKKRGFKKIYTYFLLNEKATAMKACGWDFDGLTNGGKWSCPSRPRSTKLPTGRKQRYVKEL